MSSFTNSITVCGLDQPCSSARGLNTRILGVPEEKSRAKARCTMAAP